MNNRLMFIVIIFSLVETMQGSQRQQQRSGSYRQQQPGLDYSKESIREEFIASKPLLPENLKDKFFQRYQKATTLYAKLELEKDIFKKLDYPGLKNLDREIVFIAMERYLKDKYPTIKDEQRMAYFFNMLSGMNNMNEVNLSQCLERLDVLRTTPQKSKKVSEEFTIDKIKKLLKSLNVGQDSE